MSSAPEKNDPDMTVAFIPPRLKGNAMEKDTESYLSYKLESSTSHWFSNKFRFLILVLGTLCLTSIFSNMICLNFTLICMETQKYGNMTKSIHPIYDYTQYEKTILQWSVAIAAMVATFPFSVVCTHFGAHKVFFVTGIASAISNGLIPAAARYGFHWFILVRVIQGLAYASDFAVIGVLCTRWSALKENAKFLSVLTCFSALASFITNAVSGVICDSWLGWPWVHYSHSIVSVFLFILWLVFYTDDPKANRFISRKELTIIHREKEEDHKHHKPYVPYMAIFKDKVVWSVWVNALAVILSEFFLFIYAPTYLKNVLKFSTTETGFLNSLVSAIHIPAKLLCGYASDTYHCLPERMKMSVFNTIALCIPAAIYIYLCYVPISMSWITVLLMAAVQATLGANCGGYYKCGAKATRQYAEFVIAFTQFIKCAVFFIAPLLYWIFIRDDSNALQWHSIFYIIAGTLIFANCMFLVYATDQPCEFTKLSQSVSEKDLKALKAQEAQIVENNNNKV